MACSEPWYHAPTATLSRNQFLTGKLGKVVNYTVHRLNTALQGLVVRLTICHLPFRMDSSHVTPIQDSSSLDFGLWIPRCGFRIPGTGFQSLLEELEFWIPIPDSFICIPDSTSKNLPDSGIWIPLYAVNGFKSGWIIQPVNFLLIANTPPPGPRVDSFEGQVKSNICSEDDLRSRIFGTFVVQFLACLPLLGFSNT